ncbi:MAG TPA: hypothetical protein VIR57_03020 [Chloroflexota bacterium]|jgi:hypothetical protein
MAEGKLDKLRDIAHRFRTGELSLHDAALEAGTTEEQFMNAVKSFSWVEDKAGQAGKLASGAAQTGRRLWDRWTGKK